MRNLPLTPIRLFWVIQNIDYSIALSRVGLEDFELQAIGPKSVAQPSAGDAGIIWAASQTDCALLSPGEQSVANSV